MGSHRSLISAAGITQQISWKQVDYARYLVGAGNNGHETVLVG